MPTMQAVVELSRTTVAKSVRFDDESAAGRGPAPGILSAWYTEGRKGESALLAADE